MKLMVFLPLIFSLSCVSDSRQKYLSPADLLSKAQIKLEKNKTDDAILLLEQLIYNYPGYEERELAGYLIVKAYYENKDHVMTLAEGRDYVRDYPSNELADHVQYMLADALYRQSPGYALDQSTTRDAVVEFQTLIQLYPESEWIPKVEEKLAKCIDKLAKKEYLNGTFYKRMGMYAPSEVYFKTVIAAYPDSEWADDSLFALGEAYMKQKALGDASDTFNKLTRAYPDSKWTSQAEEYLADIENWNAKD